MPVALDPSLALRMTLEDQFKVVYLAGRGKPAALYDTKGIQSCNLVDVSKNLKLVMSTNIGLGVRLPNMMIRCSACLP